MIVGFYYRFYRLLHNKALSVLLSYLARFLYFLCFLLKRAGLKHESVSMSEEEALDRISHASADPNARPDYSRVDADPDIELSIIVPVYNHADEICACIDSLISQRTARRYELILVDDGSTDGAEQLIEQYRRYDFVEIIHRKNGGIAAARNTGISHARGRYLMFVDCDDSVKPELVETLMSAAAAEDCDIAMCGHNLIKKTNGMITSVLPNIDPGINLLGYDRGAEILNYAGLPWGKVYKRELFEKVRFFPGYWYEDTIVQTLLFTQCRSFVYIPKALYDYFWYEDNFSHVQAGRKAKPKAVDRYWLLLAILKRYDELSLQRDVKFYTMLLTHLSAYYYPTVATLPEELVQAMFAAARALLLKNKPKEPVKLPCMLRLTEKAIVDNDYALWKLCSVNQ